MESTTPYQQLIDSSSFRATAVVALTSKSTVAASSSQEKKPVETKPNLDSLRPANHSLFKTNSSSSPPFHSSESARLLPASNRLESESVESVSLINSSTEADSINQMTEDSTVREDEASNHQLNAPLSGGNSKRPTSSIIESTNIQPQHEQLGDKAIHLQATPEHHETNSNASHNRQNSSNINNATANSNQSTNSTNAQPNLIAFINFNSGGKMGKSLSSKLQSILGEDHVFNLADGGPQKGLKQHLHTPNLKIVAAGGDGTVNWILSSIHSMSPPFDTVPPVGLLPLGTGNDTSRAFGWGHKFGGLEKIKAALQEMSSAHAIAYDRWHVQIEYSHRNQLSEEYISRLPLAMKETSKQPKFMKFQQEKNESAAGAPTSHNNNQQEAQQATSTSPHSNAGLTAPDGSASNERRTSHSSKRGLETSSVAVELEEKNLAVGPDTENAIVPRSAEFNNYLSFGVDAQIMSKFHHHREEHRGCYCGRICNMAWMTLFGASNFCCCQAQQLQLKLSVPDESRPGKWKPIDITSGIKAVILLNLESYAGGRHIWGKSKSRKGEYSGSDPSISDGLLEVIGVKDSGHLGRMLALKQRGIRLAQVHEVRISLESSVYVQLDGEPWLEQADVTYHIRRLHQAQMLVGNHK